MHVNLHIRIFKRDPYEAFAQKTKTSSKLWEEMYHNRYQWLSYTPADLLDFYYLKTGKKMNRMQLWRWLNRTAVYHIAQRALEEGLISLHIDNFGKHKEFLISENNRAKEESKFLI